MIGKIVDGFIGWASNRGFPQQIVTGITRVPVFTRYEFFRRDEWPDEWWLNDNGEPKCPKRPNTLPWWLPFNVFLHHWDPSPGYEEDMHDHPRWSITICLKGKIIEKTPWKDNVLTPGSIVFRSHKYIHGFSVPDGYAGKTWTLFIVGRREHKQNYFKVTKK